jgi:hypothetical protein
VADGAQDGVDGVACGAEEAVSFEQAVGLHVAEHGFDGVPAAHLAADGGGGDAAGVGDDDLEPVPLEPVAAVAAVDIGAPDRAAGEPGDLVELPGEAVAVIGAARQGPRAEHELAAGPAGVGDGEGGLHAELVSGAGLAAGDAFDLGRVEGVELAGVAGFLVADALCPRERLGEGGLARGIACDLAGDVADDPAEEGAQAAQVAHALLVAAAVQQARGLAPGMACDAGEGLAQRHTLPACQRREPLHGAQHQVAVGRVGDRLGLHGGVDDDPLHRGGLHGAAALRDGQRVGEQRLTGS